MVEPVSHFCNQLVTVAGSSVKFFHRPFLAAIQNNILGVHDDFKPVSIKPEFAGIFVGGAESKEHCIFSLWHKGNVVINGPHSLCMYAAFKVEEIPISAIGANNPRLFHCTSILGQHLEPFTIEHRLRGNICKGDICIIQYNLADGNMAAGQIFDPDGKKPILNLGCYLNSLGLCRAVGQAHIGLERLDGLINSRMFHGNILSASSQKFNIVYKDFMQAFDFIQSLTWRCFAKPLRSQRFRNNGSLDRLHKESVSAQMELSPWKAVP